MKKIAILGSTGSIGTQTLDVVRANDDLEVVGLAAGSNVELMAHYGDFTHEKICALENPKGYEVAYDGCSFEV